MRGAVAKRPAAHPCTMCSKRFTKRSNLRIHERLHTGERPYVCRFHGCGRAYKWLSSINFHEGRCERRAFGLAAAHPSNPNANGLPSSPVTPVRPPPYNNHKGELVLPPATHLKRIAKSMPGQATANGGSHPRRRLATMPVSLPPPLPQYGNGISNGINGTSGLQSIQPSQIPQHHVAPPLNIQPPQNTHHQQYYQPPVQTHQQSPSVLLQMARALPSAPLPAPLPFGTYTSMPMPATTNNAAAASLGLPTTSQSVQHHQIQRLLGAVAPPLPTPTTHHQGYPFNMTNGPDVKHEVKNEPVKNEVKAEHVHVSSALPLPAIDYSQQLAHHTTNGHPQTHTQDTMFQPQNHYQQQTHHQLPLPPTSGSIATTNHHPMLHAQQMHPQQPQLPTHHQQTQLPNGSAPAASNGANGADNTRPQCTVAGGVLDDLTATNYPFDGEQAHPEVLLF